MASSVIVVLPLGSKCVTFEVGCKENRRLVPDLEMALDLGKPKSFLAVVILANFMGSFLSVVLNQKASFFSQFCMDSYKPGKTVASLQDGSVN